MQSPNPGGFAAFPLPPFVLRTLDKKGFDTPTPIQQDAIPVACSGKDLVGIAQTGTGKSLAFALPMIARIRRGEAGLVMVPTRELALQLEELFKSFQIKTAVVIGGIPNARQVMQLRANPTVIVATPGRLLDHLGQRTVDLRRISVVVLDEADRMLDMGFQPAIEKILSHVPAKRQTMLFSATMPTEIARLAEQYLNDPARVEVAPAGTPASAVEQELVIVPHEHKSAMLSTILNEHQGSVLVFARTRHGARKLAKSVRGSGHSADELHSDRTLAQRKAALHAFKTGGARVLVATDIAARGIDVKDIALVVNYDIPENPEDYVHRIGRTGRAGASGRAVTLATPEQRRDVRDIEKLLSLKLALSRHSLPAAEPSANAGQGRNRPPIPSRGRVGRRFARPRR
jgi:ATP-dependent RNA helicase RhlE